MSKLFTKAELEAINKRKTGDLTDKSGLFSNRVKPKIQELIKLNIEELEKLITKRWKK